MPRNPAEMRFLFSIKCAAYPEPVPIIMEAAVIAIANAGLIIPEININPSGLISGDEVRNAYAPYGNRMFILYSI
jgi:hypothetical protein